jgi:hypothetical protein
MSKSLLNVSFGNTRENCGHKQNGMLILNTLTKEERPIVASVVLLQSACLLVLNYHGGYLNVQTLNSITWSGSVLKATNCHVIHFLYPLVLGFILL